MGAVAVDLNSNERKFEVMFPMHTREGVETFLEQLPYIQSAMYLAGDFDALIMIVDFQEALIDCGLTETERNVIHLVFYVDMKRVDVAKMYGVTKQTVQKWVERSLDKIAGYYAEMEGVE